MTRILIIDDDEDYLELMSSFLQKEGYETKVLNDGKEAIPEILKFSPDLVISDIMMPGITGGAILEAICENFGNKLPVIISSGTSLKMKFPRSALVSHCPKPIDFPKLIQTIEQLLNKAEQNKNK